MLAFLASAASPGRSDPSVLAIDWGGPSSLDLSGHGRPYAYSADRSRLVLALAAIYARAAATD